VAGNEAEKSVWNEEGIVVDVDRGSSYVRGWGLVKVDECYYEVGVGLISVRCWGDLATNNTSFYRSWLNSFPLLKLR